MITVQENLIGKRFGELEVIGPGERSKLGAFRRKIIIQRIS